MGLGQQRRGRRGGEAHAGSLLGQDYQPKYPPKDLSGGRGTARESIDAGIEGLPVEKGLRIGKALAPEAVMGSEDAIDNISYGAPEARAIASGIVKTAGGAAHSLATLMDPSAEEGALLEFSEAANLFADRLRPKDMNPAALIFLQGLGSTAPTLAVTAAGFATGSTPMILGGMLASGAIGGLAEAEDVAKRSKAQGSSDAVTRSKVAAVTISVGALNAIGTGGVGRQFANIAKPGLRKAWALAYRLHLAGKAEGITEALEVPVSELIMQSYDPDVDFFDGDAVIRWLKQSGQETAVSGAAGYSIGLTLASPTIVLGRAAENQYGSPEEMVEDIETEVDSEIDAEVAETAGVSSVIGASSLRDKAAAEAAPAKKAAVVDIEAKLQTTTLDATGYPTGARQLRRRMMRDLIENSWADPDYWPIDQTPESYRAFLENMWGTTLEYANDLQSKKSLLGRGEAFEKQFRNLKPGGELNPDNWPNWFGPEAEAKLRGAGEALGFTTPTEAAPTGEAAQPILSEEAIDEVVEEIAGPEEQLTLGEEVAPEEAPKLSIFQLRKIAIDNGIKHSDIKGKGAVERLQARIEDAGVPTVAAAGLTPVPSPFENRREIKQRIRAITGIVRVGQMVDSVKAFREALRLEARGARVGFLAGRRVQREARKLKDLAKKAEGRVKKMIADITSAVPDTTDVGFRKQIEAIQDSYTKAKGKKLSQLKETAKFVEERIANGEEIPIPPELLRKLSKKAFDDLTLDELTDLHTTVALLRKLGALKGKLKRSRHAQTINEAVEQLDEAVRTEGRGIFGEAALEGDEDNGSPRPVTRTQAYFLGGERMKRFFDRLDGFNPDGPWQRFFWRPIRAAAAEFNASWTAVNVKIDELAQSYGGDGQFYEMLAAERSVGDGPMLTGQERVGLVMSAADPDTRTQLVGNGIARENGDKIKITEEELADIEQSLTADERRFRDFLQGFYADQGTRVSDVFEKVYGIPFQRIGNYHPRVDAEGMADEKNVFGTKFFEDVGQEGPSSLMPRWFTRERVQGSTEVLRVDAFNVFHSQAKQVEFFMAHAGVLGDIVAIARDPRTQKALRETQGVSRRPHAKDRPDIKSLDAWFLLREWVKDVSRSGPNYRDDGIFDALRRNSATAVLGFKVTTGARQTLSTLNAMAEYHIKGGDPSAILNGWKELGVNKNGTIAWAEDTFDFVRNRNIEQFMDEMVRSWGSRGLTIDGKPMTAATRKAQEAAMLMIRTLDRYTISAVAKGVYDAEISKHGDHGAAMEMVNGILETTQPASAVRDLPYAFRQGGVLRWMTVFQNMFNQMSGQQLASLQRFRAEKLSPEELPAFFLMTVVIPILLSSVIDRGFRIPEPGRVASSGVSFVSNTFYGAGPVLNAAIYGARTGRVSAPGLVPMEPFKRGVAVVADISQGDFVRASKDMLQMFGAVTGLPASALVNLGEGLADILNEVPEAVVGPGIPDPRALITSRYSRRGAESGPKPPQGRSTRPTRATRPTRTR